MPHAGQATCRPCRAAAASQGKPQVQMVKMPAATGIACPTPGRRPAARAGQQPPFKEEEEEEEKKKKQFAGQATRRSRCGRVFCRIPAAPGIKKVCNAADRHKKMSQFPDTVRHNGQRINVSQTLIRNYYSLYRTESANITEKNTSLQIFNFILKEKYIII